LRISRETFKSLLEEETAVLDAFASAQLLDLTPFAHSPPAFAPAIRKTSLKITAKNT
jgi:hypothetical protein